MTNETSIFFILNKVYTMSNILTFYDILYEFFFFLNKILQFLRENCFTRF